jgi:hypothetical protein
MSKKITVFAIANIFLTYLLLVAFGWSAYAICGGNPTFLIPFPVLSGLFFVLDLLIIWLILKYFKMLNTRTVLIGAGEIVVLYLLFFLAYR